MKIRLWYNLYKTKKAMKPRADFKRELNASLLNRFDEIYGKQGFWYQYIWVKTTRVVIASTVGFSMIGTTAYAYNSPQVTEGSVLYPVKLSIEKVEEKTKTTPEEKVKFLIKQAERRDAEREVLETKFKISSKSGLKNVKENIVEDRIETVQEIQQVNMVGTTTTSTQPSVEVKLSEDKKIELNKEQDRPTVRESKINSKNIEEEKRNREKIVEAARKTQEQIKNVEQKLQEAKERLSDDEEGKILKKKIEERAERKRIKEEENRSRERFEDEDEFDREDNSGRQESRDDREGEKREDQERD